jgi:hypothetical protein
MPRREQCGRCGHWADGCERCGVWVPFLGAAIDGQPYCHTWAESTPTCYTQASWERTFPPREVDVTPRGLSLEITRLFYGKW